MGFEVFQQRSTGRMKAPTITVQKRGTISTNAAAAAFLAGGEVPDKEIQVELLLDREKNILGIRRATTQHTSVYTLRKQSKSESFLLAGKAFTQYYGIQTGEARRYVAKDFGDGIIGAELEGDTQMLQETRMTKIVLKQQRLDQKQRDPKARQRSRVSRRVNRLIGLATTSTGGVPLGQDST